MIQFFTNIKNGIANNPKTWRKHFEKLDGNYMVTIQPAGKRSNQQNRYLHGVLIPEFRLALVDAGYDVQDNEQAKMILKSVFLKTQITNMDTGEVIDYISDTSSLSKEQLNLLIETTIRWTAENLNYIIPYPGEQTGLSY